MFDDDLPLSLYKTNSNLSFQKGKGAIDYFLASIWCPNFTACATVAATKATTTTSATSNTNGTTVTTTTSQQPSSDVLLGDANVDGKVTTADLLILKKHLLGTSELSAQGKLNADTNKDGKVSTADLLVLKKYLLGTISNF